MPWTQKVSILECERTRTRRGGLRTPRRGAYSFNPRVRANPHPTRWWRKVAHAERRFNPRVRANPHPTSWTIAYCDFASSFNPRVRANPHPTGRGLINKEVFDVSILECERTRTRRLTLRRAIRFININVSILECERTRTRRITTVRRRVPCSFQSSSASEPAPDMTLGAIIAPRAFQSSSASEPAPDMIITSTCSRFLTFQSSSASEPAPDAALLVCCHRWLWFQSSSASEPAPDASSSARSNSSRDVSILECERTRTRRLNTVNFDAAIYVSILECERTRTRQTVFALELPIAVFQSSSASEPAPDNGNKRCTVQKSKFQSSSASEPAPDIIQVQHG